MTIRIKAYETREKMKIGKKTINDNILLDAEKLRPLHTDYFNNDESDGLIVTFVSELDDPHNSPEQVEQRRLQKIDSDRREILKQKSKDGTLTGLEEKEIIKKLAEML